jgi:L-aminopeptidase/D-esterase-like protein
MEVLKQIPAARKSGEGTSTTLGVVATNALFDKAGMTKIAQMAQDGLARAVNPAHTPDDGDTIFALATGELKDASLSLAGALAAEVVSRAIVRAALRAVGIPGYPSARDLRP